MNTTTTGRKPIRKAVFPVAGLGTRFLPATKAIPKEMLPIVDRPLIQYAVDEAREAGIDQLIFVTGRGKTAIVEDFDVAFELETTMGDLVRPGDRGGRALRHPAARRADGSPRREWRRERRGRLHETDGRGV